jgi:hypothetical protein
MFNFLDLLGEIFTKQKLSSLARLACLTQEISIQSAVSVFGIFLM